MKNDLQEPISRNAARLLAATAPAWGLGTARAPAATRCAASAPREGPAHAPAPQELSAFDWVI